MAGSETGPMTRYELYQLPDQWLLRSWWYWKPAGADDSEGHGPVPFRWLAAARPAGHQMNRWMLLALIIVAAMAAVAFGFIHWLDHACIDCCGQPSC